MPGFSRFKGGKYRLRKGALTLNAMKKYRKYRQTASKGMIGSLRFNIKHFKLSRFSPVFYQCGGANPPGLSTQVLAGQSYSLADDTPTSTGGVFGYFAATELAALFDVYMLKKVVVEIIPVGNVAQIGQPTTALPVTNFPAIHSAIDYNSSTAPTNINQLIQYSTYKRTGGSSVHKRVISPRFQVTSQVAGSSVNVMEGRRKWVNTLSNVNPSTLPHYGLRIASDSVPIGDDTTIYCWDLKMTFYFSFKDNN